MTVNRNVLLKEATLSTRNALAGLLDLLESGSDFSEASLAHIERDLRDAADLVRTSRGTGENEEFEIGERDD